MDDPLLRQGSTSNTHLDRYRARTPHWTVTEPQLVAEHDPGSAKDEAHPVASAIIDIPRNLITKERAK